MAVNDTHMFSGPYDGNVIVPAEQGMKPEQLQAGSGYSQYL